MKDIRVLHVLDHSIPDHDGYSFRSKYIIETQLQLGVKPIVITSLKHKSEVKSLEENYNGINYYRTKKSSNNRFNFIQKIPFLKEKYLMDVLKKKINQVVEKEKVDLIHAHSPSLCGYPAALVAQKKNIPFIYEMRALWEDAAVDQNKFKRNSFRYKVSRGVENEVLNKSNMVTTIAHHLKDEIVSWGITQNKVRIVPNGVDTKIFKPRQKNIALLKQYGLENKVCVGFLGSFFRFEGLELLIKAIPHIINKENSVKFLFVGDGERMNEVQSLVRENKLEDLVILTGRIPHEQVIDYYSVMDVLVYPRIRERITELVTPLKTLEAMAMEKTVLGSDVGGIKEIIEDNKNGLLFKAGDINDLTDKLLFLIRNKETRIFLGLQARLDMQKKREWSVIIKEYLDIYRLLLNGRDK